MDLNKIKTDYNEKINKAENSAKLELIRIELLGRNGLINKLFTEIKTAPNPKEYGQQLNSLKNELENIIKEKSNNTINVDSKIENCKFLWSSKGGSLASNNNNGTPTKRSFPKIGLFHI